MCGVVRSPEARKTQPDVQGQGSPGAGPGAEGGGVPRGLDALSDAVRKRYSVVLTGWQTEVLVEI